MDQVESWTKLDKLDNNEKKLYNGTKLNKNWTKLKIGGQT